MESEIFPIIQGAVGVVLEADLTDRNNQPVSQSGVTAVYLRIQNKADPRAPTLGGLCQVVVWPRVRYTFVSADTAEIGEYNALFELQNSSGAKIFVPSGRYNTIIVKRDLSPVTP